MKFFVLSDIHGSYEDLKRCKEIIDSEDGDGVIICGDYLNHGPRNAIPAGYNPGACAGLLNSFKDKIISVRGNCDSEVDQMLLEFPVLESHTRLYVFGNGTGEQSPNKRTCMVFIHHGHLFDRENLLKNNPTGTVFIQGHTHVPLLEVQEGSLFFNPGSISIPKTEAGKTFGVIETVQSGVRIQLRNLENKILKELVFHPANR
ncbi:MAG: phosphodiesterase [Candidatus Treponema excrementipullorum]|nr:phosphodiesterase [Candidatus Treponema excrementipullorum]